SASRTTSGSAGTAGGSRPSRRPPSPLWSPHAMQADGPATTNDGESIVPDLPEAGDVATRAYGRLRDPVQTPPTVIASSPDYRTRDPLPHLGRPEDAIGLLTLPHSECDTPD